MKKFLLGMLVLGVALVAGASLWSGVRSENAWRAWVAGLAEMRDVAILDSSYASGWLASEAELGLELRGPLGVAFQRHLTAAGKEDVRSRVGVIVRHRIDHGPGPLWDWLLSGSSGAPVLLTIESEFALDGETRSELAAVLGRVPSLFATTWLRASGHGETALRIPPAMLKRKAADEDAEQSVDPWTLEWKGLDGQLHFAGDGSWLTGELASPGLTHQGVERDHLLAGWQSSINWKRDSSGMMVGTTRWEVAHLAVQDRAAEASEAGPEPEADGPAQAPLPTLELDGLAGTQSARVSAGEWLTETELALAGLRLGSADMGPGRARVALRGLEVALLKALVEAPSEESATSLAPPTGGHASVWSALLAGGPVLDLATLSIETPLGAVEGQGHLKLGPVSATELPPGTHSGFRIQEGALEVRVPAGLVDAFMAERQQPLEPLLERGLLVREGDRYRTRFGVQPGRLTANEQPVDLTLLLALRALAAAPALPEPATEPAAVEPVAPTGTASARPQAGEPEAAAAAGVAPAPAAPSGAVPAAPAAPSGAVPAAPAAPSGAVPAAPAP